MEHWYNKYAALIGIFALWFVGYYLIDWSKLNASEWAAWAQAFGSVAAIGAAFHIGAKQGRDALKAIEHSYDHATQRRYKAYSVIAQAARARCEETLGIIQPDGFDPLLFHFSGLDKRFEGLIGALNAIPVHDVGTYEAVECLVALRLGLEDLRVHIQRADEHMDSLGSVLPNEVRFNCLNIIVNCEACIYRADGLIEALRG